MTNSNQEILGIHHVTAIASDPQANIDFYAGVLGLRLVKRTVNFDDPGTYHFYYGDETGTPGTILTFFPWPRARHGRHGTGQLTVTSFAIPSGSMGWWIERFKAEDVGMEGPTRRFDGEVLEFSDPDGLNLELVEDDAAGARAGRDTGPVPAEHSIRGFYGVTLTEEDGEATAALLTAMGFTQAGSDGNRQRFIVGEGDAAARVDIHAQPGAMPGTIAAGTVHHVAWRVADDAAQLAWRAKLSSLRYDVTPVLDRQYFHSIYYREPGGIIFEIATDPPGFLIDEPVEELGRDLKLPAWLEPRRTMIEARLPRIELPPA